MSYHNTGQPIIAKRLNCLLNTNLPDNAPVALTPETAIRLMERIDNIRLHAHSYPFIHNLSYGDFKPTDVLDFAYRQGLHGINIHIDDGEGHNLDNSTPEALERFKNLARQLNLAVHLEISHTNGDEIDRVINIARLLGVKNIRFYPRYEGTLSEVMAHIQADLLYAAQLADQYDLYFDFEQHETFKSTEVVQILTQVNHPRIKALFDFTNMINAYERPLAALRTMSPYIRQVHLKGAKYLEEGSGYGQLGVIHGSAEDEIPTARLLYELLLLGESSPRVICFVLEQEVNYYAPAYRRANESNNPTIPYKTPSETPFDHANPLALLNEKRWATNQVYFIQGILAEIKWLAQLYCEFSQM